MDEGLVDLSLFALSPTNDGRFNVLDDEDALASASHAVLHASPWSRPSRERTTGAAEARVHFEPTIAASGIPRSCTMKPLPQIPRRRMCDSEARCILTRMKRLGTVATAFPVPAITSSSHRKSPSPSALAGMPANSPRPVSHQNSPRAPSAEFTLSSPPSPSQARSSGFGSAPLPRRTLQQRRNPTASGPPLTLPSSPLSPAPSQPTLPMIWLPDEEMWLVADPNDVSNDIRSSQRSDGQPTSAFGSSQQDYHGYYSPFNSESSHHHNTTDSPFEYLPPYSESPPSQPSSSDLSPVQTQFMSLMMDRRSVQHQQQQQHQHQQQRQRHHQQQQQSNNRQAPPPRRTSALRPVPSRTAGITMIPPPATIMNAGEGGGDERLSPLFQEAINGVGLLSMGSADGTPPFFKHGARRDSWHSDSGISPVSSLDTDPTRKSAVQRAVSARH